jgi:hypothetical protein
LKVKLCDVNPDVQNKLPQETDDKSGIGVHYVDAYIKPMNVKLEDGTAVRCKRRGLKIILSAGAKKGEGLMRRLEVSRDPVAMLDAALEEAAKAAGIELAVENGSIFVTLAEDRDLEKGNGGTDGGKGEREEAGEPNGPGMG